MLYEETLFISGRISAIKEVNDLAQGLEKLKRWFGRVLALGIMIVEKEVCEFICNNEEMC